MQIPEAVSEILQMIWDGSLHFNKNLGVVT